MFGAASSAFAADATAKSSTKATAAKPLCSELGHPQAGKVAGKDTGMAKERSNSPVHQDCTPDSQASTDTTLTGSTSTFTPNIDLRGRSSLTIDNTTSTGDQSVSSTTNATTGDQSMSTTANSTTGNHSATSSATGSSSSDTAASSSTTANGTSKKKVK